MAAKKKMPPAMVAKMEAMKEKKSGAKKPAAKAKKK